MKKILIFLIGCIIGITAFFAINTYRNTNSGNVEIEINKDLELDDIKNIDNNLNGFPIITQQDATKLVSEQIDLTEFTISLSNRIFNKDGSQYYLFDIVNKSKTSFSEQIAINTTTGDMLAFFPESKELKSMTEFPINTPIANEQEWAGVFIDKDNEFQITLLQADNTSFEFFVSNVANEEESIISGIGRAEGGKATYSDEDFDILFIKNMDNLKVIITTKNEKLVGISGEYTLV